MKKWKTVFFIFITFALGGIILVDEARILYARWEAREIRSGEEVGAAMETCLEKVKNGLWCYEWVLADRKVPPHEYFSL